MIGTLPDPGPGGPSLRSIKVEIVLFLVCVAVLAGCAFLGSAAKDPAALAADALTAEDAAHEAAEQGCAALDEALALKAIKRTQSVADLAGRCAARK